MYMNLRYPKLSHAFLFILGVILLASAAVIFNGVQQHDAILPWGGYAVILTVLFGVLFVYYALTPFFEKNKI